MHRVEVQRFAIQLWPLPFALKFPGEYRCVAVIVPQCFAIGGLVFLTKMSPGGFVALERVDAYQLGEFQKIRDTSCALQGLIVILLTSEHANPAPARPEFVS